MLSEKFNPNDLKQVVLPGRIPPGFEHERLHGETYDFWKTRWTEIYAKAGSLEAFHVDDFLRQDSLNILTHRGRPVAMVTSTLFNFNLSSTRDHYYFKFFPEEYFKYLSDQGAELVMSQEYLLVREEFRKSQIGFSLGDVVLGLNARLFSESNADAIVAVTRRDNKVNESVYKYGFDCVLENVTGRNFPLDLVVAVQDHVRPNPDPFYAELINKLWSARADLRDQTLVYRKERMCI